MNKTGIKGFNKDLTCRDHQFEVGKTYKAEGTAQACRNGFHAIPDDQPPLAVLSYYPPAQSVYHEVIQSGDLDAYGDKLCSAVITVGVEITMGQLIQRAVDWAFARAKDNQKQHNSGYSGAASNIGDYGAASNSGTRGAASNSGTRGAALNSGYSGAALNSGYSGAASNIGDYGAASNSGTHGAASNSGTRGAASNSGTRGAASNSGTRGAALNSGYSGAASNSGIGGAAISHAYGGRVMCEGDNQALYCTELDSDFNILSVACGITGRDGIKAGVWYVCRDGKLEVA